MILTQRWLNEAKCGEPNCKHTDQEHNVLYLNSACHTRSAVEALYNKQDGCIHIICHTCKKPIATIAVARGLDS